MYEPRQPDSLIINYKVNLFHFLFLILHSAQEVQESLPAILSIGLRGLMLKLEDVAPLWSYSANGLQDILMVLGKDSPGPQ